MSFRVNRLQTEDFHISVDNEIAITTPKQKFFKPKRLHVLATMTQNHQIA